MPELPNGSNTQLLHATTVSIAGRGVIISGASGTGKSALALVLIALGAELVADDQTLVSMHHGLLYASKANSLPALIEARGVGLLTVPLVESVQVSLLIDMDEVEEMRLPEPQKAKIMGQDVTKLRKVMSDHFPAAIFLYVTHQLDR